jgi:hypothetical protein
MNGDAGKVIHEQKYKHREGAMNKSMQNFLNPKTNQRDNEKGKMLNDNRTDSIVNSFSKDARLVAF